MIIIVKSSYCVVSPIGGMLEINQFQFYKCFMFVSARVKTIYSDIHLFNFNLVKLN